MKFGIGERNIENTCNKCSKSHSSLLSPLNRTVSFQLVRLVIQSDKMEDTLGVFCRHNRDIVTTVKGVLYFALV